MFPAPLKNSAILIIHSQFRRQESAHGILKRRIVDFCCSSAIPVLIVIITIPGHCLRWILCRYYWHGFPSKHFAFLMQDFQDISGCRGVSWWAQLLRAINQPFWRGSVLMDRKERWLRWLFSILWLLFHKIKEFLVKRSHLSSIKGYRWISYLFVKEIEVTEDFFFCVVSMTKSRNRTEWPPWLDNFVNLFLWVQTQEELMEREE